MIFDLGAVLRERASIVRGEKVRVDFLKTLIKRAELQPRAGCTADEVARRAAPKTCTENFFLIRAD